MRNATVLITIPKVAIHLGPYLSDNQPDIGPMMITPAVNGSI